MNVILVDDERDLVETLAQRLKFRGINADFFTDGKSALDSIRKKRYTVAVLDIKMPGISGTNLGQKIMQIDPRIRLIFCTGQGPSSDESIQALQDGQLVLTKPINIDTLVEKIKQMSSPIRE